MKRLLEVWRQTEVIPLAFPATTGKMSKDEIVNLLKSTRFHYSMPLLMRIISLFTRKHDTHVSSVLKNV